MPLSTRSIALEILNRIESTNAFADILLEEAFKKVPFKDVDKRLLTELVYGTMRWKGRVDWIIGLFSSVKPSKMETGILNILRLAIYQMLFLERIPVSAAVNESVKMAKTKGQRQGNFVNAVLRAIDRGRNEITFPDIKTDPLRHISVKYSHPEWLVRRFMDDLGIEGAIGLCNADNEPPPLTIRTNTQETSRENLFQRLSDAGYSVELTKYSPSGLLLKGAGEIVSIPGFREGKFTVQDEASQMISFILDPKSGEKVLDACAAPGGKATHIAELMSDQGEITALDKSSQGIKKIRENLGRLGLKSVKAEMCDASKPLDFKEKWFDRILLDAPCSGTGVLRRHPEGKWQKREENIRELANSQKMLTENLSKYLKSGGTMVYSVCSIMKEEGEEIIDAFLSSHPEFILEPAFPQAGDVRSELVCKRGFFKVYSHKHGMDGFFAAKLKKL